MRYLTIAWLVILTLTLTYVIKTQTSLLKFEEAVMTDNLKNEVRFNGNDYVVIDVVEAGAVFSTDYPIYIPAYLRESQYEQLANELRLRELLLDEDSHTEEYHAV